MTQLPDTGAFATQTAAEAHPLLHSPIDAVVGFSPDFKITSWNLPAAALTGLEPGQVLGQPLGQVFPVLNQPGPVRQLEALLQSTPVRIPGLALAAEAGPGTCLAASCYPLFGPENQFAGGYALLVAAVPLVGQEPGPVAANLAQLSPESALVLQTELARGAYSTGLLALQAATNPQLELDAAMCQLLELPSETRTLPMPDFLACVHPTDRPAVRAGLEQALRNQTRFTLDFRVLTPANACKYLRALGSPVQVPASAAARLVCLCLDVTEQKKAEQLLQQQEEELRNVYNNAPCGIGWFEAVRNANGTIVDFIIRKINQAGAQIAGRPVQELLGAHYMVEFPGVKLEGIFDEYVRVVETRKPATIERAYTHENLNINLIMKASPLDDGFVLTFTDVSAQKAVQQKLEAKQYLQAKINETAPSLIAVLNLATRTATYQSKTLHQFLNRKPAKTDPGGYDLLLHLLHPDDAARLPQLLQQVTSAADYDLLRFRFRFRDALQTAHWYQVFVKIFKRDAEGHVEEVLCLVQDIDEAEQNKFLLKSTLDSSQSGIMAFEAVRDAAGKIEDFRWVLLNQPAEQLIGRKSRTVMGRRMLPEMPGNLGTGLFEKFVYVVETADPVQFEHAHTLAGAVTWYLVSAAKMDDGVTATFTNITPRKAAEEELLESKRFSEKITTASPFLIGVYVLETGKPLYFNRQRGSLLGYSEAELAHFAQSQFAPIVHPNHQSRMQAHAAALATAADGDVLQLEARFRCADGSWKWLHARDTVFKRDVDGKPTEVLTIVADVSEEMEQNSLLESVVMAAPVGICALQALRNAHHEIIDFTWRLCNQSAAALLGYSVTELMGRRLLEMSPVHMHNGVFANYARVVESGQAFTRELEFEARGRKNRVRVRASLLGDGVVVLTEEVPLKTSE